jgi:hypothetical protein
MIYEKEVGYLFLISAIPLVFVSALPVISLEDAYGEAVVVLADARYRSAVRDFKRLAQDEQEAMKWMEMATRLAGENSDEADNGCE